MGKKGSGAAARKAASKGSAEPSLPKGAIAIAVISLVCGISVYYARSGQQASGGERELSAQEGSLLEKTKLEMEASDTPSLTVQFRDAGALKKRAQTFGVDVNLTQAEFLKLANNSAFFAKRDGRQLRTWRDVVAAAKTAGEETSVLLQGPPRENAFVRHFIWPEYEPGQRIKVADVPTFDPNIPIELEPLSENPRAFYVHNFMSSDEADALVAKATAKDNPYSIRPSTVGHKAWTQGDGKKMTDSTRTSENGFDVNSPTAMRLKKRAWQLLRLSGNYDEAQVDGFQVLRYELKQAYISHMDSFPLHTSTDHNWDPASGGTNRFATILVYLSDVDDGGQTVFPNVASADPQPVPDVASELFNTGTWEHNMVKDCYSKMSVQPKKGNAILFYSQTSDGKMNPKALHGGCPVLSGTKWAANLWFWNQCRFSQCNPQHRKAGVKITDEQLKKSAR